MRVAVEQPWRVKDIVLPERDVYGIKQEDGGEKRDVLGGKGVSRGGRMREQLTEEERKVRSSYLGGSLAEDPLYPFRSSKNADDQH